MCRLLLAAGMPQNTKTAGGRNLVNQRTIHDHQAMPLKRKTPADETSSASAPLSGETSLVGGA